MKQLLTLFLIALGMANGWAQQALVNPASVTLTQAGPVTVIISGQLVGACEYGNTGRTTPPIHVTVGTVQATYSSAIGTSMSELGVVTGLIASSVATGTLDAGTYPVGSDATVPVQITVILWNESATSGTGTNALSELTLSFDSATAAEKAAFQALIVSLVQQHLDALQAQITAQQNQIDSILSQIASLQESNASDHAALQSQIDALQNTVGVQQSSIESLQQSLAATQTQYSELSETLNTLAARVTSTSGHAFKSDDTLTEIGVGLGAAAVMGGVVNFFTRDGKVFGLPVTEEVQFSTERE